MSKGLVGKPYYSPRQVQLSLKYSSQPKNPEVKNQASILHQYEEPIMNTSLWQNKSNINPDRWSCAKTFHQNQTKSNKNRSDFRRPGKGQFSWVDWAVLLHKVYKLMEEILAPHLKKRIIRDGAQFGHNGGFWAKKKQVAESITLWDPTTCLGSGAGT